jgi:tetratricopeptide (TPR) repeat protein
MKRGLYFVKQGYYNEALKDYSKYISLSQNDPQGYYERGIAYYCKNLYKRAIIDLTIGLSIKPDADAYFWRAKQYNRILKDDLALDDYNKAIELNPGYTAAIVGKAHTINNTPGNTDKAIAVISDAINSGKITDPLAYGELGNLYTFSERYKEAIVYYRKAIDNGLNDASFFANKANLEIMLDLYDDALVSINQAISLNSEMNPYYMARALIYNKTGKNEEGLKDAERILKKEPNNIEALNAKGLFCLILEEEAKQKKLDENLNN